MEDTWWRSFFRAQTMAGFAIMSYEAGDVVGDIVSESQALLEATDFLFGIAGHTVLMTADIWFGLFLGGTVLFYLNRFYESEYWAR